MMEDFIKIFNDAFNKLNLVGVHYLGSTKNDSGRTYYKFIGKFEFDAPLYFFEDNYYEDLIKNKGEILSSLHQFNENESNCVRRKFTKKIRQNGVVKMKVDFNYVFDIIPQNIVDFEFDSGRKKAVFYVLGYGI